MTKTLFLALWEIKVNEDEQFLPSSKMQINMRCLPILTYYQWAQSNKFYPSE